ncbi:MAG: T9SS type A sorting domain-containing protein [Saprospiraceae bacterium]
MKKIRIYLLASLLFLLSFNWSSAQCLIEDVTVSAHSCDGDMFSVNIDFVFLAGTDSVTIAGNGNQYGVFSTNNLPITLGPFLADNTTIYEFVVSDYQNACSDFGVVGPIDCSFSNCNISDLIAEAHPCNGDGQFLVDIDFNHQNMPSDSFQVVGNGTNYGTFAYSELWITIGPIVGDGSTNFEFIIIDQNNPNCFEETGLDPIDCNDECEITGLIVEAHPCNPEGTFYVDIDFNHQNMPSDSFHLVGNGTNYGTFAYADLWLTFGPILGDGNTVFEFIVIDSENTNCTAFTGLDPINCNPDCEIWDIEISETNCNSDDTYNFILDFNYANVNNDFFDVFANGDFFGFFAFADLPIQIENFPASGNTFDAIKICQNDLPTCCETLEFESPTCNQTCLTFDDLAIAYYGTPIYAPDDLIFTVSGVPIKIQEYENTFDGVAVLGNPSPIFDGNYLSPFMANLEFNFLQLNAAVIHLEFDFYSGGGGINIGANDAPINSASSLFDLDGVEIAPGVTLTIVPDPTDPTLGRAILDGFIGLFTIGATDALDFDNMCLDYDEFGDCWAGDTNSDFIVNNFDLLNIGLAYGAVGTPRDNASIAWIAQPSDDWMQSFEDGTNYKHADANGDGVISFSDKFAIDENFGLTHGAVDPYVTPTPSSDDPALFIIMPNPNDIGVGPFEAEIHLGGTANAVDAIYGLAFTVEFNNQIFDPTSMEIAFESGWFNNNGADDLLSFQKEEDGKLAAAVSRINQLNISGGGKIGTITGIIDDLSGYAEIDLGILDVKGITNSEILVPFNTPENYVEVGTGIFENKLNRNLSIFPNPTNDFIFIKNDNEAPIENIRLINILGQEILQKPVDENGLVELNVGNISQGIYFLEIQMDGFKVSRKIEISGR